jgi:hypothetical protein
MCTVVPNIYYVFTAPLIQAPIFNWTYLRCNWRYLDNSLRVILETSSQTQRTSSSLRNVYCGPGNIQCIYSSSYAGNNIQVYVSALLLDIFPHFDTRYTANWCQIQDTSSSLRCVNCGSVHIQCNYSSAYSAFNIQLNLPELLLEICRHLDARYTANLVANTAHILQFTLCELWSRTYTKYIQLRIFRLQYSAVGNCAAIVDIPTNLCALYCKHGAKYNTHR